MNLSDVQYLKSKMTGAMGLSDDESDSEAADDDDDDDKDKKDAAESQRQVCNDCAVGCCFVSSHSICAPCRLRGCENRLNPFPIRMSYKVTKPGFGRFMS